MFRAQTDLAAAQGQTVLDDHCLAIDSATLDPDAALATSNGRHHNALHELETDLRAAARPLRSE